MPMRSTYIGCNRYPRVKAMSPAAATMPMPREKILPLVVRAVIAGLSLELPAPLEFGAVAST